MKMNKMIDIKSIWDNQKPEGNVIVKTKIDEISHLNCFSLVWIFVCRCKFEI